MLYKFIGMVCLSCLMIGTGCMQAAAVSGQSSPGLKSAGTAVSGAAGTAPRASDPAAGIDLNLIQGDIQNIFCAGGSKVLIDAGRLYLYDVSASRVLAETDREDFVQPRYQPCGRGYAAAGQLKNSMQGKIVFYSASLKKEKELSFSQVTGPDEPILAESLAVSPDGSKIAYADGGGIAVYDTAAGSGKYILDLQPGSSAAAETGIMHIGQLQFTGDSRTLILLTGVNSGTGQSVPACGKINADGTGLVNQRAPGFVPYEIAAAYGDFALFGEDDRGLTGRAASLDAATGSIRFLPLATRQERVLFGSDTGKHYATGSLDETGCTVRIYETATAGKVFEKHIPHGGNPLYAARNPVIRVLDETKTCIVLMGNRQADLATKAECFFF